MRNPVTWAIDNVKNLNDSIWHTPLSELSKRKSYLIRQIRIVILAWRGFFNDKVQLRSSSLTLYTLMSIVPVAAIAFAIAKGFNLDQNLELIILDKFPNYKGVLEPLLLRAKSAISATSGGYMAGIGVIILFWSVMSLLNQIEGSFNHIWQISAARPWYRKFTDYLTIMLIAPVFLILSSSVTVFISTEMKDFIANSRILDFFKPVISLLIKLIPYFLTWITLTVLFIIMPNAKVKFIPALVSGVITGTVLQFLLWFYIDLQWGITRLSAIYGSFALIPLFIVLLQASWTCVLLGAELTFANQNVSRYEYENEALSISNYYKRALLLLILNIIVRNFAEGEKPIGSETIGKIVKIPVRLSREILAELTEANLISAIHENDQKERLYQPALDINKMTISFVISRIEKKGSDHKMFVRNREYERIISMLEKFEKLISKSDSNILIRDI
ncbi:MAG: YihY/virulence factor BrkB family protein [Bacteroidales bacterium]|jgi:membrane protein